MKRSDIITCILGMVAIVSLFLLLVMLDSMVEHTKSLPDNYLQERAREAWELEN